MCQQVHEHFCFGTALGENVEGNVGRLDGFDIAQLCTFLLAVQMQFNFMVQLQLGIYDV